MKIKKLDTDQTHNTSSDADLSISSDPSRALSKIRWEISRLQSLERGLAVKSSRSFTVKEESDELEEASRGKARRDTRIRTYLVIVVGLGLLAGVAAMAVLAVVKVMKGRGNDVQFVLGESGGGNSPVTFQELQMQGTPPENENAAARAEGESQVVAISREERASHMTRGSYRTWPHDVKVSVNVVSRELESEDSDDESSDSKSSVSEDQEDGTPPENENAAPSTGGDSQVVIPTARPTPKPTPRPTTTTPAPTRPTTAARPPTPRPTPGPTTRRAISLQELAQHNTVNDLWTELYGTVYDLTAFAGSHPGGSRLIVSIAGKGGLQAFESFHRQNTLQNFGRYIVGNAAPPAAEGARPTASPTYVPTKSPTKAPTTPRPTPEPTPRPTPAPTPRPTRPRPTPGPTTRTIRAPTKSPTKAPTKNPTKAPTTPRPTPEPTPRPTPAPTPRPTRPTPRPTPGPTTRTISRQELAQHNTANDLWTELYGTVYDLTNFVGSHPGGSRVIVNIAGKGGLQAFESFHKRNTLQKFDRYIVGPLE
jgi:cytochrome b involved in lipid metabolism